jgi:eukaryotic-like serine/threonine-protein kinase
MDSGLMSGALIDGKYKIVRLVGSGGMGSVYEAEHLRIRRRVAIKVLHAPVARDPKLVKRFEREAQAVARIGSHHVTDVLDFGELATGDHYMVMEYLEGETLANRVAETGTLPPEAAIAIAVQILDGLAMMHDAGIIHRDLKPANIFLVKTATDDFVKILDFGICKFGAAYDAQWTTSGSTVLGTPGYLAPEQLTTEEAGANVDLYAIGVVLYRCLVGRLPYDAESRAELLLQIRDGLRVPIEEAAPHLDKALAAIVTKSIAVARAERFQTARDFRAALLAWGKADERREPQPPTKSVASPTELEVRARRDHEPTLAEMPSPHVREALPSTTAENAESTEPIVLPPPAAGHDVAGAPKMGRASPGWAPSTVKAIVVGAVVGVAGVVVLYEALRR